MGKIYVLEDPWVSSQFLRSRLLGLLLVRDRTRMWGSISLWLMFPCERAHLHALWFADALWFPYLCPLMHCLVRNTEIAYSIVDHSTCGPSFMAGILELGILRKESFWISECIVAWISSMQRVWVTESCFSATCSFLPPPISCLPIPSLCYRLDRLIVWLQPSSEGAIDLPNGPIRSHFN